MAKASKKVSCGDDARQLIELPNIGPAMAADFVLLGISTPQALIGQDPYGLYQQLCDISGVRHDPCVLDTFIAAVRFMEGAPPHPWWFYTAERKATLAAAGYP